jgi:argininosuccinate synthase
LAVPETLHVNANEILDVRGPLIGGAVSGGLDSCTVTSWLTRKGFEVHGYTVDLGQPDEENLDAVADRMIACGAKAATILPGKEALVQQGIKVIQAQARYEGGYWNTTGIARPVTTSIILDRMAEDGVPVLFHGATGRGNDQMRFQLSANLLAPDIDVYAPWRDPEFLTEFPGRAEMIDYCEANSLPIRPARESRYSTDANILGLTHEAGDLEDVGIPPFFVEPGMGNWAWDAPETPQSVAVTFEAGVPVAIDGRTLDPVMLFESANAIAGRHGVGIGLHVIENRFVGVKSRGIYEAPAMELLGSAYEFLAQFIFDRRTREQFDSLSRTISRQIYEGYWFDLATKSALAALDEMARLVTGTVMVRLYRGNVFFETADNNRNAMPYGLFTSASSMESDAGEDASEPRFDHTASEGFAQVIQVHARTVGRRQRGGYER